MRCWHVTFSSPRRMPLFVDEASRRAAVRRIVRVCGARLVLFCIVDDHIHLVVIGPPEGVGGLAAALWRALRRTAACQLEPAHRRPVDGRRHLEWLVRYLTTQTDHHGIDAHPALWSGSCFADLVGMRVVEGFDPRRIRQLLPRLRDEELHRNVGLDLGTFGPLDGVRLRATGAVRIASAAASALAVGPALVGNAAPTIEARRAAAQVAKAAGIRPSEIGWALSITARAARRLAEQPVAPEVLHATRLRLALEDRMMRSAA